MEANNSYKIAISFFKKPENSKTQEQFAEYSFLKDLIIEAAKIGEKLDIARSDFDAFGYDLIISKQNYNSSQTIYLQLKARSSKNKNPVKNIHSTFIKSEGGRILLIKLDSKNPNPEYLLFKMNIDSKIIINKSDKNNRCSIPITEFKSITDNLYEIFK